MNYSLVSADFRTHLKILGLAVVASVLITFAVNASQFAAPPAKSKLLELQVAAHVERPTVCRFGAL